MATQLEIQHLLRQHNKAMIHMAQQIMGIVWPIVIKHSRHTGSVNFRWSVEGAQEDRVVIEIKPKEKHILTPLEKVIN